jgi:hypothetical protein
MGVALSVSSAPGGGVFDEAQKALDHLVACLGVRVAKGVDAAARGRGGRCYLLGSAGLDVELAEMCRAGEKEAPKNQLQREMLALGLPLRQVGANSRGKRAVVKRALDFVWVRLA